MFSRINYNHFTDQWPQTTVAGVGTARFSRRARLPNTISNHPISIPKLQKKQVIFNNNPAVFSEVATITQLYG